MLPFDVLRSHFSMFLKCSLAFGFIFICCNNWRRYVHGLYKPLDMFSTVVIFVLKIMFIVNVNKSNYN